MDEEFEWSDPIQHDNRGWPEGVEPDEVVWPRVSRDWLPPVAAVSIDWCHSDDPVTAYRRRIWKTPLGALEEVATCSQ